MKKILSSLMLLSILLALTTSAAFAQEATPITGSVDGVVVLTDETSGDPIVQVTLTDENGLTQVINLSLEAAESYGLVSVDPVSGEVTVNDVGEVTIQPEDVLPDAGEDEAEHPVGGALSGYFSELLGVDYETIMTAHEDGFGFGVIAQALWLSNQIDGGSETFTALLEAKASGDYSGITLADGSTPDNWGDVVKSLKKGDNLGKVMSGRAGDSTEEGATTEAEKKGNGKGNAGKNNGNGNDNENKGGKGKDNEHGNKGNGNGHGKP